MTITPNKSCPSPILSPVSAPRQVKSRTISQTSQDFTMIAGAGSSSSSCAVGRGVRRGLTLNNVGVLLWH